MPFWQIDFSRRLPRAPRSGYRLDVLRRRLRRNGARTDPCCGPTRASLLSGARRNTATAFDYSAVASLHRQIERLLRERRLRPANKLIDQFNLALQTGSVATALALTLDEVRTQVTQLFPSAGERDTFSDTQIQLAQETDPLILPPGYIATILPSLNRGSRSGIAGWTNAFILDVFTSDTETRNVGVNLLTELCNKMLAGQMQSPLWLLSRLILIPKPADSPLAPLAPGVNPPSTPVSRSPGDLLPSRGPRRHSY